MNLEESTKPRHIHSPLFYESVLRKNVLSLLKTHMKKRKDDKAFWFIAKLKKISALNLKFYMENRKDEYNIEQTDFSCFICQKALNDPLNLIVHWLFGHRQYFFKFFMVETIDKTFVLEGLIQKKIHQIKKKDSTREGFEHFQGNKYELYEKIKKRFQKIFSKETIAWGSKKKLIHRPVFIDEDSDTEEEKPSFGQDDIKQQLKGRIFYHTKQMFRKVSEDSLFKESEEEISDTDIIQAEEEAIDAYDDIEDEDKKFFKLWNKYIHEQNDIRNDRKNMIAFTSSEYVQFVVNFIKKNKVIIQKDNLRNSLVMHLTTLHIYGLLTKDEIVRTLLEYEK